MRRAIRIVGVLTVIGFGGYALWKGGRDLPVLPLDRSSFWWWLMLGHGLYLVSQVLAARAWAGTLAVFSVRLATGRAETQLLVSQIGKYVPGNVAHLLGRLALARADGVAGPVAGIAMLVEIGLVLAAGGMVFLAFLLFAPGLVRPLVPWKIGISLTGSAVALAGVMAAGIGTGIWLLAGRIRRIWPLAALEPVEAVKPLAIHAVNFILLGLSLVCVTEAIAVSGNGTFLLPVPVFTIAWVVGFLTPGAPGGIGVREGLIVLGLGMVIGEGAALTVALLHRVICVFGDLVIFAASSLCRQRLKTPEAMS